ncbi:hypothetical protein [Massilia horti]|uniref:Uncharacterized protein n=1 Tax=Massilia horti TaxID=2562153 RepID=A0A4Y9T1G3_9BURK|nr:hypothetical protein [Massilia horti]TFW31348.1 hypothetical protein E4O92_14205 [Massilia horti]
MALLQKFDPPAFLSDFNGIPGQLEAWHNAVSAWFDAVVKIELNKIAQGVDQPISETRTQYYNPSRFDPGTLIEQSIPWNAFPKELLRRFGRAEALKQADSLWHLRDYNKAVFDTPTAGDLPYRPHNEYCEWHVRRDPDTQNIVHIAFTSEPPEYWQALAGTPIPGPDNVPASFPGDKKLLLKRYRELVSQQVELADLFATKDVFDRQGNKLMAQGDYNPYNKWNTTHGIVHLCAPPNSLTAEIQLAGDATVLYKNSAQAQVVDPDALICCAMYGGPDRTSDPTIGAAVNALARIGAFVTLRNPVGLYMDHIDLGGWAAPDGGALDDCVRVVRGANNLIERLEVSVPKERGFTVSDITIGGERIQYGGQVAECITVHLVGVAAAPGTFKNPSLSCNGRCCVDPNDARTLNRAVPWKDPTPPGKVDALQDWDVQDSLSRPRHTDDAAPLPLRSRRI